jgi:multisubunit Na+/H+ antiporter MnhC subunit
VNEPRESSEAKRVYARLATLARAIVGKVGFLAIASLAAGVWLWLSLLGTMELAGWGWVLAGMVAALAFGPAAILSLFYLGLRQLISLPSRASEFAAVGRHGVSAVADSVTAKGLGTRDRAWRLLRSTFGLLKAALDSKGLLMDSVAIVRLANPVTLVMVLSAIVASFAIMALALATTLLRLVF